MTAPASLPEASLPRRAASSPRLIVASLPEPQSVNPARGELPLVAGRRLPPRSVALATAALPDPAVPGQKVAAAKAAPGGPAAPPASSGPGPAKGGSPGGPAPASLPPAKAQAPAAAKPAGPGAQKPAGPAIKPADPVVLPSIPPSPPSIAPLVNPIADRPAQAGRKVSVEVGTRIDLAFDGSGWTYLGEKSGKDGILYDSRRFEGAGIIFSLMASKSGDFLLRFQRQDAMRGTSSDELVAVSVTPRNAILVPQSGAAASATATGPAGGTATVPALATASPATGSSSPGASGTGSATASSGPLAAPALAPAALALASSPAASASGSPSLQTAPSAPPLDSPEGMLLAARNELAAARPQGAIDALDRLLSRYPAGMDEAYYLYGSALEQSGPLKDIKRAYDYYRKLRDDYPMSPLWDKASERISYIERHYFEIR